MSAKEEDEHFEQEVIKNLLPLYSQLDGHAESLIAQSAEAGQPISCTEGCSHCCSQMTNVVFAEGIVLARAVFEGDRHWMVVAKELRENAKDCHGKDITRGGYFRKNIPCVLLDQDRCSVYEVRPSACRFLYVVSPSEDCAVASNGKDVMALNMTKLEATVWEFSSVTTNGSLVAAPLPIMVLFCMMAQAPNKKAEKFLKRLCMGIPDPVEWLQEVAKNEKIFAEETKETRGAVLEAVDEVKGMFSLE